MKVSFGEATMRPVWPSGSGPGVGAPARGRVASAQRLQPQPPLRPERGIGGQHRDDARDELELAQPAQDAEARPRRDVDAVGPREPLLQVVRVPEAQGADGDGDEVPLPRADPY